MSKKLLIIKTGSTIAPLLEQGWDFEDWFIAGCQLPQDDFLVSSVYLGDGLPAHGEVAGIIITGSAAYVTDLADWNYVAADYLRAAEGLGIPILGVCYGHQLLAWTFGGVVGFHARGREIGTVDIQRDAAAQDDPLFAGLPTAFRAHVSHLQTVTTLPPGAVLLACNQFEPNHAFRLGERIWSVQFHPEFTADIVKAYIRQRADAIAAEGLDPDSLSESVGPTPEATALLPRFAQICLASGSGVVG